MSGRGCGLELYDLVLNNNLARLEQLVEQHRIDLDAKFTDVRKKSHLDFCPVHLVANRGYAGMLQYLSDMACDIHRTTSILGRTALHYSVLRHKMACFHKLLAFGADPDARDTFGNSPCHYAAEDGACDILDVLVRRPVDLDARDITLKTPLMKSTRSGKTDAVRRFVAAGCALNIRDQNRDTALHFSARQGNAQLAAVLLAGGADVDAQNRWGHTPLMEAVCYNNKDAADVFLNAGADVNRRDYRAGDAALHFAVRKNCTPMTERLLATGRVAHVYNYQGELPLYDAVVNQKIDTINLFLHYNYDMDAPIKLEYDGTGGKTLVRVAIERGNFELLRVVAKIGFVISYPAAGVATASASSAPASASASSCTSSDGELLAAVARFLADVKIVRSLKEMCRKSIRKYVGFGLHEKSAALPLPTSLTDYLLLKDIATVAL